MAIVKSDGTMDGDVQLAGPVPTITSEKVVTSNSGTGDNVAEYSTAAGTKLYIMLEANIVDNGTTGTVTISPTVPYEVSANGKYTFTLTGTVNGKEYTATHTVTVNQYTIVAGSWVNYTAGSWTQAEIDSLGDLYQGSALPTTGFKFGGFQAGSSKDASIDASGIYTSGWRVLNTDGGVINIVTAGTPEGYYHPYDSNNGYRSEYILSNGTRQTSYNTTSSGTALTPRSWTMYVNSTYADSAHCMTYDEATAISSSNDLRTISINYWLATAISSYSGSLRHIGPNGSTGDYNDIYYSVCFYIRPVVSLKSNVTITGGSGTQGDPYQLGI